MAGPARGLVLKVHEHSLTIALLGLFVLSFVTHLLSGTAEYNDLQRLRGRSPVSIGEFLFTDEFWFQSMQNWQSEFLSVGALIVLSIFLRQRGSFQSKRVAPAQRDHSLAVRAGTRDPGSVSACPSAPSAAGQPPLMSVGTIAFLGMAARLYRPRRRCLTGKVSVLDERERIQRSGRYSVDRDGHW